MARPRKPPRIEQRGRIWYVTDNQLRLSTRTEIREEAEAALQQYLAGKSSPKPPAVPTVAALLDAYHEARWRKLRNKAANRAERDARESGIDETDQIQRIRTEAALMIDRDDIGQVVYVIRSLRRYLGGLLVGHINSGVARRYEADRRAERAEKAQKAKAAGQRIRGDGGLAEATIGKDFNILRAALAWAEKEDAQGWFGQSGRKPRFEMPVTSSSEPRHRTVTKEQALKLIQAAPMPHLKLFLRIGFLSGARKEAIERLTWEMLDWEAGQYGSINFGAVEHRKKRPWLGMTPELREHMLAAHKMRCSNWVIEYRGKRAGNVKKGITSTAKKAGIPWFTSHVMKHSVVTWLAHGGQNTERKRLLEDIADHVNTTPQTLRRYYRYLFPDLEDDVVATLSLGDMDQQAALEPSAGDLGAGVGPAH